MSLLPNMVCVCVFKNAVGCLEGGKSVLKGFRCEVMSVSSQYKMNNVTRKSPLSSTDPVSSGLITEEWGNGETRVFPEVLSLQGNAQRSKKSRRMEGGRERGCVQKPRWGWGWWSGKPGECIGAEDQPAGVGV